MSKKAAKPKDEISYEIRDIVLAKIRGFPAWPAMVVDPDNVPKEVAKERPQGKKQTFYCVRFFPVGDYSWVLPRDLSKLKKHEIEAYIAEPHKKSGELMNGYRIALNPETWEQEREAARMKAEEEEAEEEVDELEGEEEADDDDEKPVKAKKRKRDSEAGAKAKPKPKKEKAEGETAPKKRKSVEKADKPAKASKKNGVKSKALIESEDEGDRTENAGPSTKATPPPPKKVKRDKEEEGDGEFARDPEALKVKEWRHKLQRAFLGKSIPTEEEMPQYNAVFTQVEEFDMSLKYLQFSKIGKVMRHIAALASDRVPRDNEFKIKDRAQALVNKWHTTLDKEKEKQHHGSANGTAEAERQATEPQHTAVDDKVTANGDMKVDEGPGDISFAAESAMGDVTMSEAA